MRKPRSRPHAIAAHRAALLAGMAALMLATVPPSPAEAMPAYPVVHAGGINAIVGSYLVVLKSDSKADVHASAKALTTRYGATHTYVYRSALQGFAAEMPAARAEELAADPEVAYVEQNHRVHKAGTQVDPAWNLDRIDQRDRPLDHAYTYPTVAANVTAYIIDSGIRISHREFGHRARYGPDFIDADSVSEDCSGHGTHVAGVVGGRTFGVAKAVRLVSVRVLDCAGNGTLAGIVAGVDWVTAHAAKPAVANVSLVGPVSQALDDAVAASVASGITYSVAAGNYAEDACEGSPARTRTAITVGATDGTDTRWAQSNVGSCLDIFAPGTDIEAAFNEDDVVTVPSSGTSAAAPHVAGAAALILARHPRATPAAVQARVLARATRGRVVDAGPASPNRLLRVIGRTTTDR